MRWANIKRASNVYRRISTEQYAAGMEQKQIGAVDRAADSAVDKRLATGDAADDILNVAWPWKIGALIAGPLAELWGVANLFLICAVLGMIFPIGIRLFTKINQLEIIEREKIKQEKNKKELEGKDGSKREYDEILDEETKLITVIE